MLQPSDETIAEMFTALTTRWYQADGSLGIGVPYSKLAKAVGTNMESFNELLQKLRQQISPLGLELAEYNLHGEVWYAIRSIYICPSELKEDEEAVLGYLMSLLEDNTRRYSVTVAQVKKKLIEGKYFNEAQLDKILKRLESLGYISRRQQKLIYHCRTLLEFSPQARIHIAEEARQRLV